MTNATFADLLTVLVAALVSFAIVDIIRHGRQARLLSLIAHLASLVGVALPFGAARGPAPAVPTKPPRLKGRPARGRSRSKTRRR